MIVLRWFIFVFLWLFWSMGVSIVANAQTPTPTSEKPDPLQDSIAKYTKLGQYPMVLSFAEKWAEKCKELNGEESAAYGAVLATKGDALLRIGKFKEAEPTLLRALEIRKKALGEEHAEVAATQNILGNLYSKLGNDPIAELYFLKGLETRQKVLGEEHLEVASSLSGLMTLNMNSGKFPKAESYGLKALEIRTKNLGDKHPDVGTILNNLGALYWNMENYPKAETFYLKALEIRKKALGENHLLVATTMNNLGIIYTIFGMLPKAEAFYLKALEIRKKALGEDNPVLASSLQNLGIVYSMMNNKPKAEAYYLKSLEIDKKAYGEDHPVLANTLDNLGKLYSGMGNYLKSETYQLKTLELRKKKSPVGQHPDVASSLGNLGNLYSIMGNYPKSETYHLKSQELRKKTIGEKYDDISLNNLGDLYWKMNIYSKAETFYLLWNAKKEAQIQRYFPFLSDQEKEKFYETNLAPYHQRFKAFCLERYAGKKTISVDFYNDQLATKGLLLNSSAKWKHRIKTSGDKKLFALFTEWEENQNKLNKLFQSTDSTERSGIDSLEKKTEAMEKELSLRSESFAKLADKKLVTWKEVQKTLKPGEAAIEMVRVNKLGIKKTVTDTSDPKKPTYKVKGLTDTIFYAALIVKPESVYPEMVLLKNGNDLEGKHLKFYQKSVANQIKDEQSYRQFWEKIGAKVGTSRRVYFSPDGVFHHINLNTLFNPKTKKYLLEEKDIRLVTATKDLVNPSPAEEENKLAELVGFPSYYAGGPTASITTTDRKSPQMSYGLRLESVGTLAELPGTKVEVDKIANVLQAKGWEVKNYTEASALEQTIKESYKPRLLHIATHGFFQPDSTKGSNPLLRSGLMLAGAGSTLKGEKSETGEDGILTAYEAMNLNLDNTDLVVLSACETGLGEIKNGEGVYGLQRAFKVAGAKSIIMSLWKVDDEATQELMVSFYKHWLSPGTTKRSAFLAAQKELKAKYPDPYYWGAFVMVGE